MARAVESSAWKYFNETRMLITIFVVIQYLGVFEFKKLNCNKTSLLMEQKWHLG